MFYETHTRVVAFRNQGRSEVFSEIFQVLVRDKAGEKGKLNALIAVEDLNKKIVTKNQLISMAQRELVVSTVLQFFSFRNKSVIFIR